MEKQCKEKQMGDIKGFSNALYKVLCVVIVTYPILIISNILSEIWRIFGMTVDVVNMGIFDIQLLRIEDSPIFIPVTTWGISIYPNSPVMELSVAYASVIAVALFIAHCLIMVGIFYFRAIFKELKCGTSPFSRKMVGRILSLAWLATFLTIFDAVNQNLSLTHIVLLVTTWLLYYIFDYGRKLQDESDTTL